MTNPKTGTSTKEKIDKYGLDRMKVLWRIVLLCRGYAQKIYSQFISIGQVTHISLMQSNELTDHILLNNLDIRSQFVFPDGGSIQVDFLHRGTLGKGLIKSQYFCAVHEENKLVPNDLVTVCRLKKVEVCLFLLVNISTTQHTRYGKLTDIDCAATLAIRPVEVVTSTTAADR